MGTTISGDTGVVFPDATTQSTAVTVATPFSINASAGAGAQLRLPEATANGVNYVAVKAADALSSNVTFTLPTADGTNGQVLQTNGSGALTFATVPTTSPAGTTGQIQYNNAGAFGALSSGTSGQALISQGAGAAPTWGSAGAMTLISSTTLSAGTSNVTVTGLSFSSYKAFFIEICSVIVSSGPSLCIQVSTDNGSVWRTSGYINSMGYAFGVTTTGGTISALANSTSFFQIGSGSGSNAYPISANIQLISPIPTTASGFATCTYTMVNANPSGPDVISYFGGGFNTSGYGQYNAIKIFPASSGTFTSGVINVYGLS